MRSPLCSGLGSRDASYPKTISACPSLPSTGSSSWPREANDHLLGLHVAAEMDMRAVGILFYLAGSSPTVSEALENLAHYSATTNEALVLEIFRHKDEVIVAIRHVQEFYEPHQQFFELLALWFICTLHRQTNVDFAPLRVTFTHARDADLREIEPAEFAGRLCCDRDRGTPRGAPPPTPPGIRVRTTAVRSG